jgi:uncharacterized protein (TIGR03000 family)
MGGSFYPGVPGYGGLGYGYGGLYGGGYGLYSGYGRYGMFGGYGAYPPGYNAYGPGFTAQGAGLGFNNPLTPNAAATGAVGSVPALGGIGLGASAPAMGVGLNWATGAATSGPSPRMRDAAPSASTPSATPAPAAEPPVAPQPPEPAMIDLTLPTRDAEVWVGGVRTTQTGTERRFVSPPLPPGSDYVYAVRVRWRDAQGEVKLQQHNVLVQAGSHVTVTFPTAK